MCAINPKHQKRFILDVYTSDNQMLEYKFLDDIRTIILETEQELNSHRYRWHFTEVERDNSEINLVIVDFID